MIDLLRAVASFLSWIWESRDQLRVVALGLILLVVISNGQFLKRVECFRRTARGVVGRARGGVRPDPSQATPFVSILVPARNEERTIERCVVSLIQQEYPDFEVVVLDDDSTDGTAAILARLAATHDHLRVLSGRPLPAGWLGKHWACHQLATVARGDLLLFTDADTHHHPQMLRDAVTALQAEGADLLTGMPHEEMGTWGEILVLPIMHWAMFSLLPLGLAHRVKNPTLSMGIGQFMLFRRVAYQIIGGFEAVRADPVDDMALARRTKKLGLRWRFVDLSSRVNCRMYRGFQEVTDGMGKSVFPALGCKLWIMAAFFLFFAWLYLEPVGLGFSWVLGFSPGSGSLFWVGAALCLALASWLLVSWRFGHPWYRAFFYPLTVALIMGIGVRSAILFWRGKACWKDRTLPGIAGDSSCEGERSVD